MDKKKEGISVEEIETFAKSHTTEVFSVLALIISSVSSLFCFFSGTGWAIFFLALGTIAAIFFPHPMERRLKQLYGFTFKQEKTTEVILGCVKLVLALFLPFLYFGLIGLLAGTSFHYYLRHAHAVHRDKHPPHVHSVSGDEHD